MELSALAGRQAFMNIPSAAASGIRYTPTTARERVAEFAETIMSPVPEDGFPTEAVAALTQSGLLSAPLPPDYGDAGWACFPAPCAHCSRR
jgi:alkylation response protein AidB-like acyl-CoA dehydrogenase